MRRLNVEGSPVPPIRREVSHHVLGRAMNDAVALVAVLFVVDVAKFLADASDVDVVPFDEEAVRRNVERRQCQFHILCIQDRAAVSSHPRSD